MNTTTDKIARLEISDLENSSSSVLVLPLEEYLRENGDKALKPHRISFYQMVIIAEGEGNVWIDSVKYNYNSKSAFTASKGRIISFEYEKTPKGYVMLFSEEFINRNPGDLEWINNLNSFDLSVEFRLLDYPMQNMLNFLFSLKKLNRKLNRAAII